VLTEWAGALFSLHFAVFVFVEASPAVSVFFDFDDLDFFVVDLYAFDSLIPCLKSCAYWLAATRAGGVWALPEIVRDATAGPKAPQFLRPASRGRMIEAWVVPFCPN
jgi:hypothetical protein